MGYTLQHGNDCQPFFPDGSQPPPYYAGSYCEGQSLSSRNSIFQYKFQFIELFEICENLPMCHCEPPETAAWQSQSERVYIGYAKGPVPA